MNKIQRIANIGFSFQGNDRMKTVHKNSKCKGVIFNNDNVITFYGDDYVEIRQCDIFTVLENAGL